MAWRAISRAISVRPCSKGPPPCAESTDDEVYEEEDDEPMRDYVVMAMAGPGGCCSPRHATAVEPSVSQLKGML